MTGRWRATAMVGVASVGLAMVGALLPSQAWADGELQTQMIELGPLPDLFVGQFAEVAATASSDLPVDLSVEGPCQLRPVDGHPVAIATGAGRCVVVAAQAGNGVWAPAPTLRQGFDFVRSEADVRITVPGPDRIQAGGPLRVLVAVTGENGDEPRPSGVVTVRVEDPEGATVDSREAVLDAHGEALPVVPEATTVDWAAGRYHVYAEYAGDAGFMAAAGAALVIDVLPGAQGSEPGDPHLSSNPERPIAGHKAVFTVSNLPRSDYPVYFTVKDFTGFNSAADASPIQNEKVPVVDGKASIEYTLPNSPKGRMLEVLVKYRRAVDFEDYKTTWVMYLVAPSQTPIIPLPPIAGKPIVQVKAAYDRDYKQWVATLTFSVKSTRDISPKFSGAVTNPHGLCYRPGGDRDGDVTMYTVVASSECKITLTLPPDETYGESTYSFTFAPMCNGRGCNPWSGRVPASIEPTDPNLPMSGRIVVLPTVPTARMDEAAQVDVGINEAIHLRVPWPVVGDQLVVDAWDNGQWNRLGSAVVAADGSAALPTFRVLDPGDYYLRIHDARTGYVMVCVD